MKTTQELNAWCAKQTGLELMGGVEPFYTRKDKFVMWAKNYSPATKIEQAIEFAFKMGYDIAFKRDGKGYDMREKADDRPMLTLMGRSAFPDCAHQIVSTLKEVENG